MRELWIRPEKTSGNRLGGVLKQKISKRDWPHLYPEQTKRRQRSGDVPRNGHRSRKSHEKTTT